MPAMGASTTGVSDTNDPMRSGRTAVGALTGPHCPRRQKLTEMQATRSPAVPAFPGSVDVRTACTTTDPGRRFAGNDHATVDSALPAPSWSVLKSSQISFCGFAYVGSTLGCTGSTEYWKCGPASSDRSPHGAECTWAPYMRWGARLRTASITVVVPSPDRDCTATRAPAGTSSS